MPDEAAPGAGSGGLSPEKAPRSAVASGHFGPSCANGRVV